MSKLIVLLLLGLILLAGVQGQSSSSTGEGATGESSTGEGATGESSTGEGATGEGAAQPVKSRTDVPEDTIFPGMQESFSIEKKDLNAKFWKVNGNSYDFPAATGADLKIKVCYGANGKPDLEFTDEQNLMGLAGRVINKQSVGTATKPCMEAQLDMRIGNQIDWTKPLVQIKARLIEECKTCLKDLDFTVSVLAYEQNSEKLVPPVLVVKKATAEIDIKANLVQNFRFVADQDIINMFVDTGITRKVRSYFHTTPIEGGQLEGRTYKKFPNVASSEIKVGDLCTGDVVQTLGNDFASDKVSYFGVVPVDKEASVSVTYRNDGQCSDAVSVSAVAALVAVVAKFLF